MSNRRQFIKNSTIATAGTILLPYCTSQSNQTSNPEEKDIGLQLYTVRDLMTKDPAKTLARVAEIGYNQIETAGYHKGKFYGMTPSAFKKITEDSGLKIVSSHVSLDSLRENPQQAIDACLESGQSYMVLPWLDSEQRSSIEQYHNHIEVMNQVSELCANSGLTFCYHNHDFEFLPLDNQLPMDLILSRTDADKVKIELDLFWISKVGLSPVEFFEQNPGRCPLWHVKDMDSSAEANMTDVGAGSIDFKAIFDAAEVSGMKHFFVEHDQPSDAIESVRNSFQHVKTLAV